MYSTIKNPNNGKLYYVNSKMGNKIIKKYITNLGGGANDTYLVDDQSGQEFYTLNVIDKSKPLLLNLGGCADYLLIDPKIYEHFNIVSVGLGCTTEGSFLLRKLKDGENLTPDEELLVDQCLISTPLPPPNKPIWQQKNPQPELCLKKSNKRVDVIGDASTEDLWERIKIFIKEKYNKEQFDIIQIPLMTAYFFFKPNDEFFIKKIYDFLTDEGTFYLDNYRGPSPSAIEGMKILDGSSDMSLFFEDKETTEEYIENNPNYKLIVSAATYGGFTPQKFTSLLNRGIIKHKPIHWTNTPLGTFCYNNQVLTEDGDVDVTRTYLKLKKIVQ